MTGQLLTALAVLSAASLAPCRAPGTRKRSRLRSSISKATAARTTSRSKPLPAACSRRVRLTSWWSRGRRTRWFLQQPNRGIECCRTQVHVALSHRQIAVLCAADPPLPSTVSRTGSAARRDSCGLLSTRPARGMSSPLVSLALLIWPPTASPRSRAFDRPCVGPGRPARAVPATRQSIPVSGEWPVVHQHALARISRRSHAV
jgi:hypothetical protein